MQEALAENKLQQFLQQAENYISCPEHQFLATFMCYKYKKPEFHVPLLKILSVPMNINFHLRMACQHGNKDVLVFCKTRPEFLQLNRRSLMQHMTNTIASGQAALFALFPIANKTMASILLRTAAQYDQIVIAKYLVEQCNAGMLQIKHKAAQQHDAVMIACKNNSLQVLDYFLQRLANKNHAAFIKAAKKGNIAAMQLFKQYNVNVDMMNARNDTALFAAIKGKHQAAIQLLSTWKAKVYVSKRRNICIAALQAGDTQMFTDYIQSMPSFDTALAVQVAITSKLPHVVQCVLPYCDVKIMDYEILPNGSAILAHFMEYMPDSVFLLKQLISTLHISLTKLFDPLRIAFRNRSFHSALLLIQISQVAWNPEILRLVSARGEYMHMRATLLKGQLFQNIAFAKAWAEKAVEHKDAELLTQWMDYGFGFDCVTKIIPTANQYQVCLPNAKKYVTLYALSEKQLYRACKILLNTKYPCAVVRQAGNNSLVFDAFPATIFIEIRNMTRFATDVVILS